MALAIPFCAGLLWTPLNLLVIYRLWSYFYGDAENAIVGWTLLTIEFGIPTLVGFLCVRREFGRYAYWVLPIYIPLALMLINEALVLALPLVMRDHL